MGPALVAPSSPTVAGFESLVVAFLLLIIGYLVVDLVFRGREVDVIVRIGLSLPAVMAVSFVFMMIHITSGGRFFASPLTVRIATGALLLGLVILRLRSRRQRAPVPSAPLIALGVIVLVGLIVWGRAVFQLLPAARGDAFLHVGWASQLRNGTVFPTNALTGEIPNYYPWLFHSLVAWVSTIIPGGRPFHALGPLQLVQVFGSVTGLFTFGYVIARGWLAGVTTALLGSLAGGLAFLAPGRELVYDVRGAKSLVASTWGDLMATRSYNLALHNLAPIFPREITYAMVPTLLLFLALATKTRKSAYLVASGCLIGIIGLAGGEAFFVSIGVAAAFVLSGIFPGRLRVAVCIGIPAAALYALWFVPLIINYVRYEGFFDLSSLPVVMTWTQVLGAWGIVTPLAIAGTVLLVMRFKKDPGEGKIPLLYVVTMAVFLIAITAIGTSIGSGFETLGRAHRYWPLFFQACAIVGGLGLAWILEKATKVHVVLATALFVAVAGVALSSPLIASDLMGKTEYPDPTLVAALEGDESSWLTQLSPRLGDRCVIAISTRMDHMTVEAFAYTGYRMPTYVWTRPKLNAARVRWRDIYAFIVPESKRRADVEALSDPETAPARFSAVVDEYGLDRVVVPVDLLGTPAVEGYESTVGSRKNAAYAILTTGDCSG